MTNKTKKPRFMHYSPCRRSTVCGAMKRAFESSDTTAWKRVKAISDVSRVTCPLCVDWIEHAIANKPRRSLALFRADRTAYGEELE